MCRFPFVIRFVRVGNGHAVLRGGRRKTTREQFEAWMKHEMTLKHIVSFDLPGNYELLILRKPR
jgi:hypothetical protein